MVTIFHRKTVFHLKILSNINFTTKTFEDQRLLCKWTLLHKKFIKKFDNKVLIDNIFIERLSFRVEVDFLFPFLRKRKAANLAKGSNLEVFLKEELPFLRAE